MDKPIETQQETVGKQDKSDKQTPAPASGNSRNILMMVGAGVVLVILGVAVGWVGHNHFNHMNMPNKMMDDVGPRFEMLHEHGDMINATDGSAVNHLSGVVTQVNGDTFTIAGNGTTKTIKTTSSTTYNTGSGKVSVNDSVVVRGTDNNGTFTATSVMVLN